MRIEGSLKGSLRVLGSFKGSCRVYGCFMDAFKASFNYSRLFSGFL